MSEERNTSNSNAETLQIRPNLVDTAVNFLLNPAVIDKPYAHKTAFLKKKGLSDAEISLAYEKAEKDPKYREFQTNGVANRPFLPPPVPVYGTSVSFLSRLSRISSSLIILGVALFGAHYIYKNYIEPLIFGNDSKKKKSESLETQLLELTKSLSQIEKNISALEENVSYQKTQIDKFVQNEVNEYCPTPLALRELKLEIASVKSLLVNRHQFPALPKVTPPTIPEWQLPSKEIEGSASKQNGESNEHLASKNNPSDDLFPAVPKVASPSAPEGQFPLSKDPVDTPKQNGEDIHEHAVVSKTMPVDDDHKDDTVTKEFEMESFQNEQSKKVNELPV